METSKLSANNVEAEYTEYLRVQCGSVGADTNVEGCVNPRLALATRYAMAVRESEKKSAREIKQLRDAVRQAHDALNPMCYSPIPSLMTIRDVVQLLRDAMN